VDATFLQRAQRDAFRRLAAQLGVPFTLFDFQAHEETLQRRVAHRSAPIAPEQYAAYGEPDRVKIVWTLEAEALGPELTRFASETRVVATDDRARARFRRYWCTFGIGIQMIRWLLLSAVCRQAEQRWRIRLPGLSSSQSHPADTAE
jgi:hypothetical protein